MRLKTLTTGLLIGLLAGCTGTNQDTTVTSTLEPQQNELDSISFPQNSCGEKLPNDPKAYPVKYYPVFIDYSEGNLQSVKSKYCKDALKKIREKTGKDAIQVASFLSIERANKFQNFMINKIGSGEVGEPTVIEAKRKSEGTDSPAQPKLPVGEAAKLTPEQVKQLISLEKSNKLGIAFKVITPTYIPDGFQIGEFEIEDISQVASYKIVYRNSSNLCFSIESDIGKGWGSGPGEERTVEVTSPALGKVLLGYTEFSQISKKPSIAFDSAPIIIGKQGYFFNSPGILTQECNTISLQEAIKIVESLQYLNP